MPNSALSEFLRRCWQKDQVDWSWHTEAVVQHLKHAMKSKRPLLINVPPSWGRKVKS